MRSPDTSRNQDGKGCDSHDDSNIPCPDHAPCRKDYRRRRGRVVNASNELIGVPLETGFDRDCDGKEQKRHAREHPGSEHKSKTIARAADPDVTGAKKRKQGNLPTNRSISESARARESVPDRQP